MTNGKCDGFFCLSLRLQCFSKNSEKKQKGCNLFEKDKRTKKDTTLKIVLKA